MIFKTKAVLTCIECGQAKSFTVEADVSAEKLEEAKDIRNWEQDVFNLKPIEFESICPNCKYDRAA
jgi:hypothetical protein